MEPVLRTRTTAAWIALFEDKAVPCGPINTVAQAFDDPQVQARGVRIELPRDDGLPAVAGVANPMRLSATPVVYHRAPPALGQHTHEVLQQLGLDEARIAALRSNGAI
ncbi:Formyl-coenzyme A transferase [compost metagenome]